MPTSAAHIASHRRAGLACCWLGITQLLLAHTCQARLFSFASHGSELMGPAARLLRGTQARSADQLMEGLESRSSKGNKDA